ncbi:MAG: 50S ribosomal protein L24 [Verrucomicrobia bacterium]|nr:50S ribosomal protein L24 [Verrucomicrobiota bacterium]
MASVHVKKGDEVVVLSGADRGKRGKIIEVMPGKQRVIVEGIRMIKRHMRKSQAHPEGRIVTKEGMLHWSKVMRASVYDAKPRRAKAAAEVAQS